MKKPVYKGYTHHIPVQLLGLWKRFCCSRGWHAWDEVVSITSHYLYCDACKKVLLISDSSALSKDFISSMERNQ